MSNATLKELDDHCRCRPGSHVTLKY